MNWKKIKSFKDKVSTCVNRKLYYYDYDLHNFIAKHMCLHLEGHKSTLLWATCRS